MKVFNLLVLFFFGVSAHASFNDKVIGQERNLAYICKVYDLNVREYLAQFQIKGFKPDTGLLFVKTKDCESRYTNLIIEEPYIGLCNIGSFYLKVAPMDVSTESLLYSTEQYFGVRLLCEPVIYAQTPPAN